MLTAVECTDAGVTLVLSVDGHTARFHSGTPTEVRFNMQVACGTLPGGGRAVLVLYRPAGSSGSMGELLAVEAASLTPSGTLP